MKKQLAEANVSDKMIRRQRAIIGSMTKTERRKPDVLQASRKRRIAAGAGVEVAEVNRLLKQHRQMQDAFKFLAKDGGKGFAKVANLMGANGGLDRLRAMGGGPAPADTAAPQPAAGLPGLGGPAPRPGVLPGLGGGAPPFNPFKKS